MTSHPHHQLRKVRRPWPLLLSLLLLSCRDPRLVPVPPCEPSEEVCDGRDNDCDGEVDEALYDSCSGACGTGTIKCEAGKWSECPVRAPVAETCNGKDDDCDGKTDEYEDVGVKPCYPRDPSELAQPDSACRFGVERCVVGVWTCQGAVTPKPEECNGVNDDCDSETDEGTSGALDLVIAVDYSGSMATVITSLRTTTAGWADKLEDAGRSDVRIALVGAPSDAMFSSGPVVMQDLTTPSAFARALDMHPNADGVGNEPTIDAIALVAQRDGGLPLSWAPSSSTRRALALFTDEMPQSWTTPSHTEQEAQALALKEGLRVFVFTSDASWYMWSPRPFSSATGLEADLDNVVRQGSCR